MNLLDIFTESTLPEQLTELSTEKLAQYKKAASADATAADQRGDYEKGHKRFKGIVKATQKQFANDAKAGVAEGNKKKKKKKKSSQSLRGYFFPGYAYYGAGDSGEGGGGDGGGGESKNHGMEEAKGLKKRVRIVKGSEAGKTGTIGEVRHGAFKGAPKTFTVDIDGGGSIQLPKEALRLLKDQGMAECAGPATHRIGLTVTDPNHPMVSKRDETYHKTVRVTGDDREKAINGAIAHYRRKGYKVHDHHYIGTVDEAQLDELSPKTLGSYAKKAAVDAKFLGHQAGAQQGDAMAHAKRPGDGADAGSDIDDRAHKRLKGVNRAVDKLTRIDEFAPPGGDDDEYDLLVKLVKMWWLGDERQHAKAAQTLASMGIDIDEDDPNIILRKGTQFLKFPMDDFQPGVAEGSLNELSKNTLKSYSRERGTTIHQDQRDADRARDTAADKKKHGNTRAAADWEDEASWLDKRAEKGAKGVAQAAIKIAKKGMAEGLKSMYHNAVAKHYGRKADDAFDNGDEEGFKKSMDKNISHKLKAGEKIPQVRDPKKFQQGMAEGFNAEYDDEAGMAHTNLHTIARSAQGLLDTINDEENLPEWVQEKIVKAQAMLVAAWDYLKSQEEQGIDPRMGMNEMSGVGGVNSYREIQTFKNPPSRDPQDRLPSHIKILIQQLKRDPKYTPEQRLELIQNLVSQHTIDRKIGEDISVDGRALEAGAIVYNGAIGVGEVLGSDGRTVRVRSWEGRENRLAPSTVRFVANRETQPTLYTWKGRPQVGVLDRLNQRFRERDQALAEQQLAELSFLGSECTKDCSGHRAGYEWSHRKGLRQGNSPYSPSFNKGAALAVAGK